MSASADNASGTAHDSSHTEEQSIPKDESVKTIYRNVSGDGSSWTTGSGDTLNFIFKRSVNDDRTFGKFRGIMIDGEQVSDENYTAEAGSVIIRLSPKYMKTLAEGEHTLTAVFRDGNKSADR